jgi:hypothetical protein
MDPRWRRQGVLTVTITVFVGVLLLVAQLVADARHVEMALLKRDAAASADLKWYAGFFSNLGLMVWGGAVALGAFGWWALRRHPETRSLAAALGSYAALSAFLGLDDMAQLHEEVVPGHLGLSERYVFAAEALMFLAFLVLNRRQLLRHMPVVLPAALAGFGLSLGVDLVDQVWLAPAIVEDGSKLVAICLWAAAGATLLAAGLRPSADP